MTNLEIGGTVGTLGGISAGTVAGVKHGVLLAGVGFLGGGVVGWIAGVLGTVVVLAVATGVSGRPGSAQPAVATALQGRGDGRDPAGHLTRS